MNPEDFNVGLMQEDLVNQIQYLQMPRMSGKTQVIPPLGGQPGAYRNRTADVIFESGYMSDEEYARLGEGQRHKLGDMLEQAGLQPRFSSGSSSWSWPLPTPQITEESTVLDTIIKLYTCYMEQDVRSPMPHLAGPPGVGKSEIIYEFGRMIGRTVHTVNVSRLSPLELEGVQMPIGSAEGGDHRLSLLHSTIWTQLEEGDIVLLDEFLRGFPEVYNGLLDIMTSREVAGFKLPKVFFIAASNSVAAYDKALEDRLLHIFVPDLRKKSGDLGRAKWMLIDHLGLNPKVHGTQEMADLFANEVLPMYEVLDQFTGKAQVGTTTLKGQSIRKLIGQAKLREVQSPYLKDLIAMNNTMSMVSGDQKPQFVFLLDGRHPPAGYENRARKLVGNDRLTEIQATNLRLNLQLIEMEEARKETTTTTGRDQIDDDVFE